MNSYDGFSQTLIDILQDPFISCFHFKYSNITKLLHSKHRRPAPPVRVVSLWHSTLYKCLDIRVIPCDLLQFNGVHLSSLTSNKRETRTIQTTLVAVYVALVLC